MCKAIEWKALNISIMLDFNLCPLMEIFIFIVECGKNFL